MKKYPNPKTFDPSEEEIAAAAKRLVKSSIPKSSMIYIKKRRKIMRIIETIKVEYDSVECHHIISPEFYECIWQAELILSACGINKTEFLKERETKTSYFS